MNTVDCCCDEPSKDMNDDVVDDLPVIDDRRARSLTLVNDEREMIGN